jgi:hypothetical protein
LRRANRGVQMLELGCEAHANLEGIRHDEMI